MPWARMSSGGTPTPVLPMMTEPVASAGTSCQDLLGQLHAEGVVVVGDEEAHAGVGRRRGVDGDDGDARVGGVLDGPEERVGGQALQHDAVGLGLGDGHEEGGLLARVTRVGRGDLDLDAGVQLADRLAAVGHLHEGVRLGLPVDEPELGGFSVLGDRGDAADGGQGQARDRHAEHATHARAVAARGLDPWLHLLFLLVPETGVDTAGPVLVRPVRQMDGAPREPCLVSPAAQRGGAGAGRGRRWTRRRG